MSMYRAVILLTLLPILAWSQVSSPLGYFEVNYDRGCAPFTVEVRNTSSVSTFSFLYNEDQGFTQQTTYTYDEPGTYTITMAVENLEPGTDEITITVEEPLIPQFEVSLCNNNGFSLEITDTYYDAFEINISDGSAPQFLAPGDIYNHSILGPPGAYSINVTGYLEDAAPNCADSTVTITSTPEIRLPVLDQIITRSDSSLQVDHLLGENVRYTLNQATNNDLNFNETTPIEDNQQPSFITDLNTRSTFYCYFVSAYDGCADSTYNSDTACSIAFNAQYAPRAHNLRWASISGSTKQIIKNGGALTTVETSSGNYLDENVLCQREDRYSMSGFDGAVRVSTDTLSLTGRFTNVSGLENFVVTFADQSLFVSWDLAGAGIQEFVLRRSFNKMDYQVVSRQTEPLYNDPSPYLAGNEYCYTLQYFDSCGNRSDIYGPVCATILEGRFIQGEHQLEWSPYESFQEQVSGYVLFRQDSTGANIPLDTLTDNFSYSEFDQNLSRQVSVYVVGVLDENGQVFTNSNRYRSVAGAFFNIPNAFSPNGDQINEEWYFGSRYIEQVEVFIYNRWGNLVAYLDRIDASWDGTDENGEVLPSGNYTYVCRGIDQVGNAIREKGNIILIK